MRLWKWVLWVGIGLFLVSRVLVLMAFPIFNDEAIYLQYAQLINEDFGKYKFISQGAVYADWKPPLMYWIGSVFVGMVEDPLLAGRLAVFFVSLLGLYGVYLFVRELFGKKEAALAVLLYALFPPALFFNSHYVAETFVFSFVPFMYWAFLKAIGGVRIRPWYMVAAGAFGALVILAKQSGMVYVILAMLLPLVPFGRKDEKTRQLDWRGLAAGFGIVAVGLLLGYIFSRIGIAPGSAEVRSRFDSGWLMSLGEVLEFPLQTWKMNALRVWDYYRYYYSVLILAPLAYFAYLGARSAWHRQFKEAVLLLGFIGGSCAILFFLKGFNEYIYNTAVIVFLIPILARTLSAALAAAAGEEGPRRAVRAAGAAVLAVFVLLGAHWAYQDGLMRVSPGGYIRRSSPWAVGNYLVNWSGGFGVAETIEFLKAQPQPGLVFADPQWGNPRVAIEVWEKQYPGMRIIGITGEFHSAEGTQALKNAAREYPFLTRLAVFSAATNQSRTIWQTNIERHMCDERSEIQVEQGQPPIVICRF